MIERGFTLVIPLYNKAHCVRQTLDSVLNNHGEYPFKCIIVDDDSTDGSSQIGEEYDTKYPDVFTYYKIKHHGNKTPVNARNTGIRLAETEYIGFLDADDELCAGFIDRGCNFLDEHHEYSLYGNGNIIHDNDNNYSIRKCSIDVVNNFIDYLCNEGLSTHFCASVYKTQLIKECLFRNVFSEDVLFQLEYIYKNEPIYIDSTITNSIIWNRMFNDSYQWNEQRTNEHGMYEVFKSLENLVPNFKYKFYLDENGSFWFGYK